MKIKTWLLLSYFIVMILPLIAAYLLVVWIQTYNDRQKVDEYVELRNQMEETIANLDDSTLYTSDANFNTIEKELSRGQSITMYNSNGIILYSSKPSFNSTMYTLGKKELYKNLYKLDEGYRTYAYKQPVFDDSELVGFFDTEISRDKWVTGVTYRGYYVTGIFILTFGLIYFIMICLVNKKLNRRLIGLMNNMTAFASGERFEKRTTNNDEIGKLTKHFYQMKHQIEESRQVIAKEQETKEYLIASVSHDLKTPLTSIKAYSEFLGDGSLTEDEQDDYRRVISEKADFMHQMLDDLLTYTLLQSPSRDEHFVEVEGNEFFEMLVSDYDVECDRHGIVLFSDVDVNGMYPVNPKQLMRVSDNLMSNAMQHTKQGHKMWIGTFSGKNMPPQWLFEFIKTSDLQIDENYVYFIVQNEGSGIPEEKKSYVFDPIYQADDARSKQNKHGTGLGLSISKQIIEKHGGWIELFSKETVGTCVVCILPKLKEG